MGILLAFLGVGVILASFAQLAILFMAMPAGSSFESLQNDMMRAMKDPENVNAMRLMQAVGTLLIMFVPAWLYATISWRKPAFWLGFNDKFNLKQLVLAIVIILCASLVASSLADISKAVVSNFPDLNATARRMEDTYNEQVIAMSNLRSWPEYFAAVVLMALLPAIFEEVFFRGAMQNIMIRWMRNAAVAIIVSSLIFSIVHYSIYLFLSRALLGLVLGLLYYYSKNIWLPIIAHFFNNGLAVTQMWILKLNNKNVDVEALDPAIPWYVGLLGAVALFFLFRLYQKYSAENRNRVAAREQVLLAEADPFNAWAANSNDTDR